jgi:two-component system chemotaxis response regulator CheB
MDHNAGRRFLVVEDDATVSAMIEQALNSMGYEIDVVRDGQAGLTRMMEQEYDAVITDWMMPELDGIEMVRRARAELKPGPPILMITMLTSDEARKHALDSGADTFLAKPLRPSVLIESVETVLARREQPPVSGFEIPDISTPHMREFNVLAIAASTGGPPVLQNLLQNLKHRDDTALMIVQHAPDWAIEDLAVRLSEQTDWTVRLAAQGMEIIPGNGYIAPGDYHMLCEGDPPRVVLTKDPPENYVRPAADPMLRTCAKLFGKNTTALIVSGMGRDGALGSMYVDSANGRVYVQKPETAIASSMPESVLKAVPRAVVGTLDALPEQLSNRFNRLRRDGDIRP